MEIALAAAAGALALLLLVNLKFSAKRIDHQLGHLYAVADPAFARAMGSLLGPALLPGNRVTALCNGDEIFPEMLGAIAGARRTIAFETYIYWSGSIGKAFSDALSERARAGVKVHVLVDWIGSGKMDQQLIEQMERAGVEFVKYHPPRWYTLRRLNNRTHRKLLVVDGTVGFTGGVGIADKWLGNAQDPDHWRDSHFKLEGPAVAQMQSAFLDNWIETKATVLHGDDYFPPLPPAGRQIAQVFKSSVDEASESARLMYLLSIASATDSVRIANAYFVPDGLSVRTLVSAAKRGVKVEIIVPGRHTDALVVGKASRASWGELLDAGVEIYEYQPTMYHVKVMVVDTRWTSVGSTNFDSRSFRLNDEANLNILDPEFAKRQADDFEQDKAKSRAVTVEMWRRRPVGERIAERVAALLGPQL